MQNERFRDPTRGFGGLVLRLLGGSADDARLGWDCGCLDGRDVLDRPLGVEQLLDRVLDLLLDVLVVRVLEEAADRSDTTLTQVFILFAFSMRLELFIWGVEWCKLPQTPRGNPYCFSLRSIEGLNGAHFFVFGSVYLIKNAFLAFLNSLPERFARLKIAILCPHSLHLSFKKTAYSFKSMFIYKKSPESLTKLNCKNWIIPKLKVVLFWIHSLHMAFNNKSNLLESIFITKKSLKISLNLNS